MTDVEGEICRLCLGKSVSLVSVFDYDPLDSNLNLPLSDKISVCLSVHILREDKFTTKVCHNCICKVDEFYCFYNKAAECQKMLAQWAYDIHISAPKEASATAEFVVDVLSLPPVIVPEEKDVLNFPSHVNKQNDNLGSTDMSVVTNYIDIDQLEPLNQVKGVSDFDLNVFDNKLKNTNLSCGDCNLQFKTMNAMKKHVKEKHSSYVCSCGARFTCLRYLTRHEARHSTRPTIPCKFCGKLFINNSEMKEHQKSHQVGEKISCSLCPYSTLYKSNMSRHVKRHNKDYPLFCDICNEGCYSKDELATHNIKKHGAAPFYCKTCNKNFTSRGYLYDHNKTTHWITSKDFLCETCGKAFKTKNATKRHMKIHLGLKFCCTICNKTMNSAYSLKKHLKAHKGEKDVICYICGKAFVDKKYMAAHLRSHTGERPYSCNECGKRFTQATTLKVHTRYHTGERPYACQLCGTGFVTKSLLNTHLKNHEKHL